MPGWPDLLSGFKTLREVDLNKIRRQAEQPLHVAVVGNRGSGKSTLIAQLLDGPRSGEQEGIPPVSEHYAGAEIPVKSFNIVILMLDAAQPDHSLEKELFKKVKQVKVPIVVCYNKIDTAHDPQAIMNGALEWPGAEVIACSAIDRKALTRRLAPAMLRACSGNEVLLARNIPMMRETVSQKLIDDTCFINSAYSLTTGLGEINVFLDLPLNIADIVILTKNQALMAYKISLAMGLTSDWKETVPKMAAVVGNAFIWRQAARQLVGLIPAYGIIPKVAVSYAGTYAVGQAVYHWCANGEKLKPETLKALFATAMKHGREEARLLLSKRKAARLPAGNDYIGI
jgi:uncharacterized protein (DUF697 family)